MLSPKQSVDLSPQEIEVIQSALQTQEKILSVQSRAGGDGTVLNRLSELRQVLQTIRRQRSGEESSGFASVARALFC